MGIFWAGSVAFFGILAITLSNVHSSVTTFRVYNEKRILERLATAPVVSASFSSRTGLDAAPTPSRTILPQLHHPVRKNKSNGKRKKRIRKVIRKVRRRTTTTEIPQYDINPLSKYEADGVQVYESLRRRRKHPKYQTKESDLQRAESGNPFVNSTAPISSDFAGEGGGLEFQLHILHPLLHGDSVLTHAQPKLPENKTVRISHHLSEEVAGNVPVAPDLKKIRRKHPLHNPDSLISGHAQVAKTRNSNRNRRPQGKISSKIRQKHVTFVEPSRDLPSSTAYPPITSQTISVSKSRPRTTTRTTTTRPTIRLTNPTRFPKTTNPTRIPKTTNPTRIPKIGNPNRNPITTNPTRSTKITHIPKIANPTRIPKTTSPTRIPKTTSPTRIPKTTSPTWIPKTTSPTRIPKPTNPTRIHKTENAVYIPTTTNSPRTHKPTTSVATTEYSEPTQFAQLIPTRSPPIPGAESPHVIIFPPDDNRHDFQPQRTSTPSSPQQDILEQLFGLGTSTPTPFLTSNPSSPSVNDNIYDLFNFFQPTTPLPTTAVTSPPKNENPLTTARPHKTAESKKKSEQEVKPTPSEGDVDNLLQLALLQGLFQGGSSGNTQQPENSASDLNSLLSLLGQAPAGQTPTSAPTLPTTTTKPPTTGTPLQAALNNMISILSNPFGQTNAQRRPSTSLFGGGNIFGGNGGGGSLFGSGTSLFGGGNSLFNLSPGASATTTTVLAKPSTTPSPTVAENDLLAQLLQLGILADQDQRKAPPSPKSPRKPAEESGLDIPLILSGNWQGAGNERKKNQNPTQPQPSETMQLLNVLLNNNEKKEPVRPSGPYWWLDLNAFTGGDPTADPMAGIRPKLGQREYFIKV